MKNKKRWKKNRFVGYDTIEGIETYVGMNRKPIKVKVSKGWEYLLK